MKRFLAVLASLLFLSCAAPREPAWERYPLVPVPTEDIAYPAPKETAPHVEAIPDSDPVSTVETDEFKMTWSASTTAAVGGFSLELRQGSYMDAHAKLEVRGAGLAIKGMFERGVGELRGSYGQDVTRKGGSWKARFSRGPSRWARWEKRGLDVLIEFDSRNSAESQSKRVQIPGELFSEAARARAEALGALDAVREEVNAPPP